MSAWITATLVANGYHSSSVESSSIVAEVILDSRISHLERERGEGGEGGREGGREGGEGGGREGPNKREVNSN